MTTLAIIILIGFALVIVPALYLRIKEEDLDDITQSDLGMMEEDARQ